MRDDFLVTESNNTSALDAAFQSSLAEDRENYVPVHGEVLSSFLYGKLSVEQCAKAYDMTVEQIEDHLRRDIGED